MNEWNESMKRRIEFVKAMEVVVDTYQHDTGKEKLGMADIDDLVETIKYELYYKNGVITEEEYENILNRS